MPVQDSLTRGMYIHIPFCLQKCRYCDFYSESLIRRDWLECYTAALLGEIERQAQIFVPGRLASIYIGGGTPSLLSSRQLNTIIEAVSRNFKIADQAEISIEANPATLKLHWLQQITSIGINRLSLGVQSFSDQELKILGRVHNRQGVMGSIELLHKANLKNFNIDLIYGIPGQSIGDWLSNLQQAIECSPRHLSTYLLQPGNDTPMAADIEQGSLTLLDDDIEAAMYYATLDFLQERGFEHYEISNFCQPGYECRHNLNYWQAGEYIGIGAGAVSYTNGRRYMNRVNWREYVDSLATDQGCEVEELEQMSAPELLADALITGLRMCQGINLKEYSERFNRDIIHEYAAVIDCGITKGLLKMENGQLSLTNKGYFLSNEVLCQFIT